MRPHLGGLSCGRVWLRLPRRGAGLRHFLRPTGLPALLERYLPVDDARCRLAPGTAVWLVVTNLLLGRAPLYALGEWAAPFAPHLLRLATGEAAALNDDRVGRALEHLFDADRASLLTELILGVVARFGVETRAAQRLHVGERARGIFRRDRDPARRQTHSRDHLQALKDHRPDLKQLVFILTVAADGAYRLPTGWPTATPTTTRPTCPPGTAWPRCSDAPTSSTSPTRSWPAPPRWVTSPHTVAGSSRCCLAAGARTSGSVTGPGPGRRGGRAGPRRPSPDGRRCCCTETPAPRAVCSSIRR